jgi:hypothetical protein
MPDWQPRSHGIPLARWVEELSRSLDPGARERLTEALVLHQRYRFDPNGLTLAERGRLRELCDALQPRS